MWTITTNKTPFIYIEDTTGAEHLISLNKISHFVYDSDGVVVVMDVDGQEPIKLKGVPMSQVLELFNIDKSKK
jgi:hypothetical protein